MNFIPENVEFLRYLKEPGLRRLVCRVTCNFSFEEATSSSKFLSSEKKYIYIPLIDAVKFKMQAETSSVAKRDIS